MKKIVNLENADRVTKQYLIDYLMVEKGFVQPDATEAVNGIIDAMVEALRVGADVNISNFGTLRPETHNAQLRRNPQTGERFPVPARNTVRWTPSPTLVKVLNGEIERDALSRKAPKSL